MNEFKFKVIESVCYPSAPVGFSTKTIELAQFSTYQLALEYVLIKGKNRLKNDLELKFTYYITDENYKI